MKAKHSEHDVQKKELSLIKLSWPIFVETILFMLLGMVDVLVLSRFDDLAASSVNTANQAVSVVTIVFTVISGAGGILLSQYLGAGRKKEAAKTAVLSIAMQLLAGLIVSLILLFFSQPILTFIGAKGQILQFAGEYLSIVGGFLFFQAVMNAMTVIMRSHGQTRLPMYVTVGINILNTLLDIIFVLGLFGLPKMGVTGVAIATVFSRILGTVVLGILLFRTILSPKDLPLQSLSARHYVYRTQLSFRTGTDCKDLHTIYHDTLLHLFCVHRSGKSDHHRTFSRRRQNRRSQKAGLCFSQNRPADRCERFRYRHPAAHTADLYLHFRSSRDLYCIRHLLYQSVS